ncbi:MAG: ATP-binding protein [Arcobacter sp.]|uniref:sensor histidine kinase n=1 Tax=Arcobacter sp. TaxID=1872629 RepID=UPI003B002B90
MRSTYFVAFFFLLLISSLIYNIVEDNRRVSNYFDFDEYIADIVVIDNNFNKFISSDIGFINFDFINDQIERANFNIKKIKEANIFDNIADRSLKKEFLSVSELLKKKMRIIERLKSHNAILNNSLRNNIKIIEQIEDKRYLNIFVKIVALNFSSDPSMDSLKEQLEELIPKNRFQELFLVHSKIIIKKMKEYKALKEDGSVLAFGRELESFEKNYSSHTKELILGIKNIILALLFLLSILIFGFLYYSYKVLKSQLELKRFKNAVDNSNNFVVVTNKDKKIKYINKSMSSVTGYCLNEVIDKTPAIFAAGIIPEDYYKQMNEDIYSGEKWTGEFINKDKEGNLIYEKATISPIFNESGKIEEFLAIKQDVTKEKEILKSLKEKDHRLTQQARMVIMNEILNSIAHQWRQPLSIISTAASGLLIHKEYGTLNDKLFKDLTDSIMNNSQYLSQTIDNFKSFFKTGNEVTIFNIRNSFEKSYKLIEYRLSNLQIKYIFNCDEGSIVLKGIENDLIQVFVNILNNSMDALENLGNMTKLILVDISKDENNAYIKIKDDALGVSEEIISKIFEPYFTTKHNFQGTGMGLYISHQIIVEQFKGDISLENITFSWNKAQYKGVECVITIPLSDDNFENERPTLGAN